MVCSEPLCSMFLVGTLAARLAPVDPFQRPGSYRFMTGNFLLYHVGHLDVVFFLVPVFCPSFLVIMICHLELFPRLFILLVHYDAFVYALCEPKICTLKCLSIETLKTIDIPYIPNGKLMVFRCLSISAHYN